MTFIVTGKFDREEIIASVEAVCGDWKSGESGRNQTNPTFVGKTHVVERGNVTREHVTLAFPAPSGADTDAMTAEMLATYLGASTNSRLYWAVVQNGFADEATSDYIGLSDTGLLYIYLYVDPARTEESLDVVRNGPFDLQGPQQRLHRAMGRGLGFVQHVGNLAGTRSPSVTQNPKDSCLNSSQLNWRHGNSFRINSNDHLMY